MSRYRRTVKCNERGCHHAVGAEGSTAKFPDAGERREYVETTTQRLLEQHYQVTHPDKAPPAPELQKVLT